MSEITLAKKYAKALFEIARTEKIEDTVYNDLTSILAIIESDKTLKKIWFDRRINKTDKNTLLNKLLESKTTKICLRFIELVINKKRESIFKYMVDYYYQNLTESKNIRDVLVSSAFELEEKEIKILKDKLLEVTGASSVNLSFTVDKSLIGGLLVRIKDQIFDGTILNKLNKLRERVVR